MKKFLPLLALAFVVGCRSPLPEKVVRIESDHPGGRVFLSTGVSMTSKNMGKDYLGTTPLEWKTKTNRDGSFILPDAPGPAFVPPVAIFFCDPPHGSSNLVSAQQVYHGEASFLEAQKVPSGIFFDLHPKPEPPPKK